MILLLIFAFVSGLLTILAPCIWPLLPIVLSSAVNGNKAKPLGITLGIVGSFASFTLTVSYLVKIIPFDPNLLRIFAVAVIGFFGLTLIIPQLAQLFESLISRLSGRLAGNKIRAENRTATGQGFKSGLITGIALGVVWSPCAGPILATIATLAATQSVNLGIIIVTLAYVTGIGIPLFVFVSYGAKLFSRLKKISPYTGRIQKIFGLIMLLTSAAILTNYDKLIEAKLLNIFPSYSNLLINLESNPNVKTELDKLKGKNKLVGNETLNKNIVMLTPGAGLPDLGPAPDFAGISHWLNTDLELSIGSLQGKVVLVDFWTYTCINCIRTLPFVTGWYEKYKNQGFVVVGIHTPEFEFEKNTGNVMGALKQYNIHYPVGQDNGYQTWNNYNNNYWPAKYLIDAKGHVRYTHFGEGSYEETEMKIKILLEEAGRKTDAQTLRIEAQTPGIELTPETYLGTRRRTFGSFKLEGKWDEQEEYISSVKGSVLDINFYADKVYLVITPKTPNDQLRVIMDGKPADAENSGKDVKNGSVVFKASHPNDLYNLIDLRGSPGNHNLRLEFGSGEIKVFAFTFG